MVVANRAYAQVPKIYPYPGVKEKTKTVQRPRIDTRQLRRVLAGVMVLALALLVVYRYGEISYTNMEINNLSNTRNAVVDEQRHLELNIAQLTALERLEDVAINQLGMQYPHPDQVNFVGYQNPERGDSDGE